MATHDLTANADFDMGTPPANNRSKGKATKKRVVHSYASENRLLRSQVAFALTVLRRPAPDPATREALVALAVEFLEGV